MSKAFIFPGQGSQYVGMGKELCEMFPSARKIFDEADEILGFKLTDLCFNGPLDQLNATDIQQPAVFVTSAAALEAMKESEKYKEVSADVTAGLSLGEYTAYYAAGAIDFASALRLVQSRSRFMQQAAVSSGGGMVAIVGLEDEKVCELCREASNGEVLVPANYNCPGQLVVSGHKSACQRIAESAEKNGAMKAIVLDVAGAFHSPLMQSAADQLKPILNESPFASPKIPVIANVDCESHVAAEKIRSTLYTQVTSATHWGKTIQKMLQSGVTEFYEIGPKRTLAGFLKRIDRKAKCVNIGERADF